MYKLRGHIAILLSVTFIIPIIYQSLHVICHSKEGQSECTQIGLTNKCNVIVQSSSDVHQCPVCDYKFTIYQIPDFFKVERVKCQFKTWIDRLSKPYPEKLPKTRIIPRAPPFTVFLLINLF